VAGGTDEAHPHHLSHGFLHFEQETCRCANGSRWRMLGAERPRAKIELRSDRVLADLRGAQHAVEQQVEVMGHLLGALARPDV
jgi:hypothetical protein